jgi:tRNA(Ile)-lysidine synthase
VDLLNIRRVLLEECHVDPALPILAGISGGPDSLCLLDILRRLEFRIVVAHFDHCLRPDSAEDAAHVQQVAESFGLPFILGRENVRQFAQTQRLSLEEAARKARYRFLFVTARKQGTQAVAVAHTADDQVETVLMHLLRGSGLSGLRGMAFRADAPEWESKIPLIRPLLGTWRTEIMDYCQQHNLHPHFDPTNEDTAFYRNRLRHQLIPILEEYNPQARQVIWRMSRTLAADHDVLDEYLQPLWDACLLEQGAGFVSLSRPAFLALRLAGQRSLMRRAIAVLRPALRDIDFSAVSRAIEFITHPTVTRQVDLVSNLRLFLEGDNIFLAEWNAPVIDRDWPQLPLDSVLSLPAPGEVSLLNGFHLRASLEDATHQGEFTQPSGDPFQVWLDADQVVLPLSVRPRRPGDRYRPLGMDSHSLKLSDFFINHGLPRRARPGWPLVCSGDAIAWVPGYQPAHDCRVTPATRRLLHLEVFKK